MKPMAEIKSRLDSLRKFAERCRGKQLIFLYRTPDRTEKRGSIDDLISDDGAFVRVMSGNRLTDLDKMIEYELKNITTAEEPAEREI